tara:strand:+ start:617 stop:898 length:282 start_codon:yes stop_codon:yes gene_type:complete
MKKSFPFQLISLAFLMFIPNVVKANYVLVIGTYRQGPGSRAEVSGITSPSLFAIPMKDLKTCEEAGEQIINDIYKPVWQFDGKWTCVYSGVED